MEQKLEIEQTKILCPKCGTDITEQGYELMHKITGYSIDNLKNGGIKQVRTEIIIGQTVLKSTGAKVVNKENAREICEEVYKKLKTTLQPEITKEKEEEIREEAEELARKESWQKEQTINDLKEEIKQYKRGIKELEQNYNATLERIEGHLGKFLNLPAFKGIGQEKFIAKTLVKFVKNDEFTREKATNEGEDIKATVKENKQELAVVVIESKNNKKFKKEYLTKIRSYMDKYKTNYGILALKTMPDTAQDDRLYEITEDGIWITSLDYLPFCYLAVRELVKKAKQLDIDVTKNKGEYLELINKFRSTVESKEYRNKILSIQGNIRLLRQASDRLRSNSKIHCNTLDKIAKGIVNDIATIESLNKEAIGGDLNAS